MKRQRGRGRKPGGGGGNYHNNNQGGGGGGHFHPNRSLDSNGPETKVRGTASHINERYLQLARDAASSGDRVLSENYLQHADHYFRLWRSMQPAVPVQQQQQNFSDNADYDVEDDGVQDGDGSEESESRAEGDEQSEAENQGDRPRDADRFDGDRGPRRGRNRRRFSPDGERQGNPEAREGDNREPQSEGGEVREAREPREQREFREPRRERNDSGEPRRERAEGGGEPRPPRRERLEGEQQREPRRERQPREDRDSGSREGFSDGPKPAFLRSGGGGNAE